MILSSQLDARRHGNPIRDIAIVGGGLAGLSAACVLAESGYQVRLLERRPYVGGRASSYEHPGTGEIVDNCQHILLGCCTNLIGFYRQLKVENQIRWFDRITFLEPGGRQSVMQPGPFPAPFHNSLSFLRSSALSKADKLAIARGMMAFLHSIPADNSENFSDWLRRRGQTRRAIDRFWNPVLVSALNEDLDRISVHYAAMVFRRAFMESAQGGWMGVPAIPLSELYGHALQFIQSHGGDATLRANVGGISWNGATSRWKVAFDSGSIDADAVILALPFEAMRKLLPNILPNQAKYAETLAAQLDRFEHSPITGIHLWFDRNVTGLPHAALLDTTIQWMYNKSLLQPSIRESGNGSYLELVVSASKSLVNKSRQEIIDLAIRELSEFFPRVREAILTKATVIKEVRATFSVTPGLDQFRPNAVTDWPRLFLAGDWTNIGWPSTMEGAVRSGYLTAEALTKSAGKPQDFLLPDLPAKGFMRLFARS